VGALAVLVTAAIGAGIYRYWSRPAPLEPPAVDLTDADPKVVQAIEAAREQVRKAPGSAPAWGKLGMLLYAHEFRTECVPCFREAERLEPQQPYWPYFQGVALAGQGQPDTALPKLRRAVELWGNEPVPRLRLAELLLAQGHSTEAETEFQELLRKAPAGAQEALITRAYLGLGQAALERGDLQASMDFLQRCQDSPYTRTTARTRMADICRTQGDPAAAEKLLRPLANWPADLPWADPYVEECNRLQTGLVAMLNRAGMLLMHNQNAEAHQVLQQTVQEYPDSSFAWYLLGRALLGLRNLPRSEAALRHAVQVDPKLVEGHYYLGVVLAKRGKDHEAIASFRKAVELKPDYTLAQVDLGRRLKLEGDTTGAIEAFRMVVRCEPHNSRAHRELGALLAEQGQWAQAREHLQHAVDLDPEDTEARKLLEQVRDKRPAPKGR
jgi:tetratricopeptide (TPR) repeat protein